MNRLFRVSRIAVQQTPHTLHTLQHRGYMKVGGPDPFFHALLSLDSGAILDVYEESHEDPVVMERAMNSLWALAKVDDTQRSAMRSCGNVSEAVKTIMAYAVEAKNESLCEAVIEYLVMVEEFSDSHPLVEQAVTAFPDNMKIANKA